MTRSVRSRFLCHRASSSVVNPHLLFILGIMGCSLVVEHPSSKWKVLGLTPSWFMEKFNMVSELGSIELGQARIFENLYCGAKGCCKMNYTQTKDGLVIKRASSSVVEHPSSKWEVHIQTKDGPITKRVVA